MTEVYKIVTGIPPSVMHSLVFSGNFYRKQENRQIWCENSDVLLNVKTLSPLMNFSYKQKQGNIISVNVGYPKSTRKTFARKILFIHRLGSKP